MKISTLGIDLIVCSSGELSPTATNHLEYLRNLFATDFSGVPTREIEDVTDLSQALRQALTENRQPWRLAIALTDPISINRSWNNGDGGGVFVQLERLPRETLVVLCTERMRQPPTTVPPRSTLMPMDADDWRAKLELRLWRWLDSLAGY